MLLPICDAPNFWNKVPIFHQNLQDASWLPFQAPSWPLIPITNAKPLYLTFHYNALLALS